MIRLRPSLRRSPFALLATTLVLVAALAGAGCGDDSGGDDDPRALLQTAASKEIDSADVDLSAKADVPGFPILGSRLALTASGPIESNGAGALPTLDWRVSFGGGGQSFPARLTVVDDRAFVEFQLRSYEADPKLLDQLGLSGGKGTGSGDTAVSLKQLGIDPSGWLRNPKVEDGEEIGGDSTREITGTVDVPAVVDDLLRIVDPSAIAKRLGDGSDLPDFSGKDIDRVQDAIKRIDVEVNVDDEGYPRRVYAKLRFEVPEGVDAGAIERGTIAVELVLNEIGVDVNVEPPADPRPLSDLLRLAGLIFGIDELSDIWREPGS